MLNLNMKLMVLGLCLCAANAFAGGNSSGGGFYGYVNGQWILLDDLEQGKEIHPDAEPYFAPLAEILKQVDQEIPELGTELRAPLSTKTWHLVPFPLKCENPDSPADIQLSAGACQDDNDVWIEEAKFNASAKDQLIEHELIQSVRLMLNELKEQYFPDRKVISPSSVRAIKRALSQNPFPSAEGLKKILNKYGFVGYSTQLEIDQAKAAENHWNDEIVQFSERLNSMETKCKVNFPLPWKSPVAAYENARDCLKKLLDELDQLAINPDPANKNPQLNDKFRMMIEAKQTDLFVDIVLLNQDIQTRKFEDLHGL